MGNGISPTVPFARPMGHKDVQKERTPETPKRSAETRIAQLQRLIGKAERLEFQRFFQQTPYFSLSDRQLVNSAISESPAIMERVAGELQPHVQLAAVSDAILHPLPGRSTIEEKKRQDRADIGFSEWMQRTHPNTLNAALQGKFVNFRASAKLFGVLVSDPSRLIQTMGHNHSRIMGDNLTIAAELINLVCGPLSKQHGPLTRSDIESAAAAMILRYGQFEMGITRTGSL